DRARSSGRPGAPGDLHGRGERGLREPGRPGPALSAGAFRTGHGAAGLVGRRRSARRTGSGPGCAVQHCRSLRPGGQRLPRLCRDEPRRARLQRAGHGGGRRSCAMSPETKGFLLLSIIKMLVVFTVVLVGVALLTLMERKVSAWMQNRRGPNRVGWAGLLQPAADGLKNILKEETRPARANRLLFVMAPAMAFIPALMLSAVIPFAAPLELNFDFTIPVLGRFVHEGRMPMVVADLPVGFLFVLAISSMGIYGIALAGWSSNSKYSLLGGLRATAQMVSSEVAMGMSLIPVLLLAGNVSFDAIIAEQQRSLWFVL